MNGYYEFSTNLDEGQAAALGFGPFEQMLLPGKHNTQGPHS